MDLIQGFPTITEMVAFRTVNIPRPKDMTFKFQESLHPVLTYCNRLY